MLTIGDIVAFALIAFAIGFIFMGGVWNIPAIICGIIGVSILIPKCKTEE